MSCVVSEDRGETFDRRFNAGLCDDSASKATRFSDEASLLNQQLSGNRRLAHAPGISHG